jgi:hypothetical protein
MTQTSFEFVAGWFGKAEKNAKVRRNDDSARLWADGLEHLNALHKEASDLREVARAMREWIDAVPPDTVLPAMPGFDRDWADEIIDR